jgi:N-acetylneuraminic acid mutarotase
VKYQSGQETFKAVEEFIKEQPDKIRILKSGHIYHGQNNEFGFLATMKPTDKSKVKLVYVGQLKLGLASGYGCYIFNEGNGLYQG